MGAVIDKGSFERLSARLERARGDAAVQILAGGRTWSDPGHFVAPTVVELRDPQHAFLCDELFGPILSVHPYDDDGWAQVLSLVDSTSPYALTGSIFCGDRTALAQAERALANAAGNLYVNDKPTGAIVGQQPFGGSRASGTNDKAGSWLNLARWTSPRVVKENFAGVQYGASFAPR
jgi:1-pyrroline-5-carboxylate dehydrogenase